MVARLSWEQYALKLAEVAALRSEDPFVKVGACAIRKNRTIAGTGYNGAPAGIKIDWSNRDERRKRVIHAECNCLAFCSPGDIDFLAVTMMPCSDCLKQIATYGVKRVVFRGLYDKDTFAMELAKEFGIKLEQIEL